MPIPARALGAVLMAAALGTTACVPVRSHQGYIVDQALVDSIQPGIDNRQSVMQTLGRPTLASQFNEGDWYYVSRQSSNLGFQGLRPKEQMTLRVRFDARGNVVSIDRTGAELIASVDPWGKKTPTLGHKRSFFEDLFGNIGTVGAPGTGGPGGGGNTGP